MTDREPSDIALLLPWYVSGHLDADETARVEAALAASADLRRELEDERRLRRAIAEAPMAEPKDFDPVTLLDAPVSARPSLRPSLRPHRVDWLRPALAAAVALAVVEGVALAWLSQPSVYRTATGPAREQSESMRFAVHFVESATIAQIRAALDEAGAGIVRGPLPDGAYIVDAPRGEPVVEILKRSGIAREIARTS